MKQLLPFLLVFFFLYDLASSQPTTLQLTETLVIGKEQSNEPGYILGQPDKVQVDSNGTIYISDRSDHTIRVFDSEGTYLHSIGGRGRGPGEFLELTDFRLKENGNLVALDRAQSKVVVFDPEGTILHEHSLPRYIEASAIFIFPVDNGNQYLLGYINMMQQEPNGHFLHLFDATFENKISEHYDLFETYFDGANPLEERLSKSYSKYSSQFDMGSQIAIVPNIYTGTIYTFNPENLNTSVMGNLIDKFYEELAWEQSDALLRDSPNGLMIMSGSAGRYIIRIKSSHFGLVSNPNFLIQFYGEFYGEEIIPLVNVYAANHSLLINQNLTNLPYKFINEENRYTFTPAYLNNDNKLYVIDTEYRDLYPAIRVFETNLGEFLEE